MIKWLLKKMFGKKKVEEKPKTKVSDEDVISALMTAVGNENIFARKCTSKEADIDIEKVLVKYFQKGFGGLLKLKSQDDIYYNC